MTAAPRTPAPRSAGVLVFRRSPALQVLLGHMGGPFWARKQEGAWSIPKGLLEGSEEPEEAARREFLEETGLPLPHGSLQPLGHIRTSGRKIVTAWALEADVDLAAFRPGTFRLEWPPRSGRMIDVPEIDDLRWLPLEEARPLLTAAQRPFLERLEALLSEPA